MRAHSRRGFLKQTLGVCWTGATLLEQAVFRAAQARAQSVEAPANLFDIEKVAEGVYAVLARPQAIVNCNAAIFENARDVLIVDTHSKPSAVASLVAQIRKQITSKPIRYVVNTHFHWDHTQGTPTYKRIAPHADVLASTATRRLIADGAGAFKDSLEQTRKSLEGHKARLASAKSGAEKAYYQSVVSQTAAYLEEMSDYTPELPNVTFDRDLVIHDPAHELRLAFRGRGHTSGDVVVYCSQKKVVATGDLLHGALPYIGDGYPREWPLTLYQVAEFGFEHVISGHGPVQHTRERLYQQAAYIEELTDKVANGTRAGHTLAQLQEEIAPSTLFSLRNGGYGEYLMKTLSAAAAPGVTAETVLAAAVRTNVGHVFARLEST